MDRRECHCRLQARAGHHLRRGAGGRLPAAPPRPRGRRRGPGGQGPAQGAAAAEAAADGGRARGARGGGPGAAAGRLRGGPGRPGPEAGGRRRGHSRLPGGAQDRRNLHHGPGGAPRLLGRHGRGVGEPRPGLARDHGPPHVAHERAEAALGVCGEGQAQLRRGPLEPGVHGGQRGVPALRQRQRRPRAAPGRCQVLQRHLP
mmetsp:Transcript_30249/g.96653  ORF Transcript_30249/g.96653 Transcript_30249/m.96653 type:complete len:202 (+) Transcript_30249:165-770(+)